MLCVRCVLPQVLSGSGMTSLRNIVYVWYVQQCTPVKSKTTTPVFVYEVVFMKRSGYPCLYSTIQQLAMHAWGICVKRKCM